jgi:signal transduction histidine kinase
MHTTIQASPIGLRESHLADIGELAGPLAHEVNNLLNNMSLHLAMMQQTSPAPLLADMLAIRQDIARVAGVVLQHQRYRGRYTLEPTLLDLNLSLGNVVQETTKSHTEIPLVVEMAPRLPRIQGYEADLRRLCRFLLGNAVRAVDPAGPAIVVRTLLSDGAPVLEIEDAGADIPSEALPQFFDIGPKHREGMCCLELAACRSIVRRLNGRLRAHGRLGGGLIVSVHFPKEGQPL